jgi:hypothetical protein
VKLAFLDIETSGRDPKIHQVIEFAMVLDDLENPLPLGDLPCFWAYVEHQHYICEAEAIVMNARIFEKLARKSPLTGVEQILAPGFLCSQLWQWMQKHGYEPDHRDERTRFIAAGKNLDAFDLAFMNEMEAWTSRFQPRARKIDPGSMYALHTDSEPPDMKTCLERAGISHNYDHHALNDCFATVKLVRKHMLGRF